MIPVAYLWFVFALVALCTASKTLSQCKKVCVLDDLGCVTKGAEAQYRSIIAGISGLIEPMDPLYIPNIDGEYKSTTHSLSNIVLRGLQGCKVTKLRLKVSEEKYFYNIHCPELTACFQNEDNGTSCLLSDKKIVVTACKYDILNIGEYGVFVENGDHMPHFFIQSVQTEVSPKGKLTYDINDLSDDSCGEEHTKKHKDKETKKGKHHDHSKKDKEDKKSNHDKDDEESKKDKDLKKNKDDEKPKKDEDDEKQKKDKDDKDSKKDKEDETLKKDKNAKKDKDDVKPKKDKDNEKSIKEKEDDKDKKDKDDKKSKIDKEDENSKKDEKVKKDKEDKEADKSKKDEKDKKDKEEDKSKKDEKIKKDKEDKEADKSKKDEKDKDDKESKKPKKDKRSIQHDDLDDCQKKTAEYLLSLIVKKAMVMLLHSVDIHNRHFLMGEVLPG